MKNTWQPSSSASRLYHVGILLVKVSQKNKNCKPPMDPPPPHPSWGRRNPLTRRHCQPESFCTYLQNWLKIKSKHRTSLESLRTVWKVSWESGKSKECGHFISGQFEQICQITVLTVNKCHKASWQALTPSLTKQMPIWTSIFTA